MPAILNTHGCENFSQTSAQRHRMYFLLNNKAVKQGAQPSKVQISRLAYSVSSEGLVGVERSPYCTSRLVDRDGPGSHLPATCIPPAGIYPISIHRAAVTATHAQ